MAEHASCGFDVVDVLLGEPDQDVAFADHELIPVRMLNEFAYCPRLAYLEWVQGEFTENLDTRQGSFGHRNVDKPTTKSVPPASASGGCESPDSVSHVPPSKSAPLATATTGCESGESPDSFSNVLEIKSAPVDTPGEIADGCPTSDLPKNQGIHIPRSPGEIANGNATNGADRSNNKLDLEASRDSWVHGAGAPTEPPVAAALKVRSLTLSAYREGLVAKLDVLEMEGTVVTPVEYKKGAIPNNFEQAWEPERVQLCAQGLILRENGFTCESGELYYIESHHRVTVPFDDALVMRTRELVRRLRETAESTKLPPPLVDSPKCPRCSLVGICLPDETNLLMPHPVETSAESLPLSSASGGCETPDSSAHIEASDDAITSLPSKHERNGHHGINSATRDVFPPSPLVSTRVRQLVPARDDALPLYVKEQGAFVGKDGDRLIVRQRESRLASVPLIDVSQVSLFGNVQMSAQAMREVVDRGIPVCHFSYGGWFHAMTTGHVQKNIELRMAQFSAAADASASLALAKGFISAKIKNSRTMLRRHGDEKYRSELDQLAEWSQKAERAISAESLLGLEGMAAKVYFAGFARILKGGEKFEMTGRNRRPPRDPINAILSFVYSLLAKEVTIAVRVVGFEPLLGFFHKPRYGRPSLALDLAEEFRPIIADSTTMMVVNNGEVGPSSFISRAGAVALTEAGRKAVIAAFERRMEQEITHPLFGYKISYRRVLEVQARLLSRVLLGEIDKYPGFCTR